MRLAETSSSKAVWAARQSLKPSLSVASFTDKKIRPLFLPLYIDSSSTIKARAVGERALIRGDCQRDRRIMRTELSRPNRSGLRPVASTRLRLVSLDSLPLHHGCTANLADFLLDHRLIVGGGVVRAVGRALCGATVRFCGGSGPYRVQWTIGRTARRHLFTPLSVPTGWIIDAASALRVYRGPERRH